MGVREPARGGGLAQAAEGTLRKRSRETPGSDEGVPGERIR